MNSQVKVKNNRVLCQRHERQKCEACQVDYEALNEMAQTIFKEGGPEAPVQFMTEEGGPPAPSMTNGTIPPFEYARRVELLKQEGNGQYKAKNFPQAVQLYSQALEMAYARPLWYPTQGLEEEVSVLLSNRAAAEMDQGNYELAVLDAERCTELRNAWSKGWFRKGRALEGLARWKEAQEAYQTGAAMAQAEGDERSARDMNEAARRCGGSVN